MTVENQWQSSEVVGKWCVLKYDGQLYPGIITEKNNTHVRVRCMKTIMANRFYRSIREDILWYPFQDNPVYHPTREANHSQFHGN